MNSIDALPEHAFCELVTAVIQAEKDVHGRLKTLVMIQLDKFLKGESITGSFFTHDQMVHDLRCPGMIALLYTRMVRELEKNHETQVPADLPC